MAARGTIAKEKAANIIAKAFGNDFAGEFDKKLYVWVEENGEKVQLALSMTCPKIPVGNIDYKAEPGGSLDFENMSAAATSSPTRAAVEITDEEKKNIEDLMKRLGL